MYIKTSSILRQNIYEISDYITLISTKSNHYVWISYKTLGKMAPKIGAMKKTRKMIIIINVYFIKQISWITLYYIPEMF